MTPGVEITGDEVGVQIIGGRNIVVSNPDAGFSITYRKDGVAPMLVAIDGIDRSSEPARIKFWAQRHPIRLVALDQTSPKLYGKAPDGGRGNLKKPRRPPIRGFFFLELVLARKARVSPRDKIALYRARCRSPSRVAETAEPRAGFPEGQVQLIAHRVWGLGSPVIRGFVPSHMAHLLFAALL